MLDAFTNLHKRDALTLLEIAKKNDHSLDSLILLLKKQLPVPVQTPVSPPRIKKCPQCVGTMMETRIDGVPIFECKKCWYSEMI